VNEPAVALKVALAALAAIDIDDGTVMLPVELNGMMVGTATGADIVSVQTAVAVGASDAGLHVRPLSSEVGMVVAIPPVNVVTIWLPESAAPIPLEIPIRAEVVPAARVTATVATLPSGIRLLLIPLARHI